MAEQGLFSEFPPTSKEAWLAKMEKDLKGKPLKDLYWQLEEQVELAPFYHPDDRSGEPPPPLSAGRSSNDWEIGEYIDVKDIAQANKDALEGLQGGVEAPLFRLHSPLSGGQLEQLLQGIELAYASVHLGEYYTEKAPWELFRQLTALVEKRGFDSQAVAGSMDFDPLLDWSTPPLEKLAELIRHCRDNMPRFRPFQANAHRFHSGIENTSAELALTIAKGSEYLARLSELGLAADTVNAHMQFSIALSQSYFVEIAKLRALRLLWANVMKAYGKEAQEPFIVAHFAKESQDDNPNTNMIRASTQAMSAVIGGANRLYVLPANYALKEDSTSFTRRIARNVQHLLKMESHLHRAVDPGAGSFYIEELTGKLASQAWAQFKELEAKGEFK